MLDLDGERTDDLLKTRIKELWQKRKRWLIGGLLLVLLAGGWSVFNHFRQPPAGTPVKVTTVEPGDLAVSVLVDGKVELAVWENVTAKVGGRLDKISVEKGQVVRAGDILAELDRDTLMQKEAEARTSLEIEQLTLERNRVAAESELTVARENRQQAKETLAQDQANLERLQKLHAAGAVSLRELEDAGHNFEKAVSVVRQQEQRLAEVETGQAKLDLAVKEAQVELKRLQWATAQNDLADAVIRAPIDGTVLTIDADLGDMLATGTQVMTIGPTDRLSVKAEVSEADVPLLKPGLTAEVTGASLGERKLIGKVSLISPVAQTKEKETSEKTTIPVMVAVENPDGLARSGANVRVSFRVAELTGVLTLPHEAIREAREGREALVVRDGVVQVCSIKTGLSNDMSMEIKEGLQPGDQVILNPDENLHDGDQVRVLPPGTNTDQPG
ncbi:MAG: efflux RND transporter periplasmic adaptor subunit, partial [Heliobacteriaceae bacterium]|nr:efflux RND transporter periplasmic adaptor subunit [Heliobacteriaceae bacterium]